ncbi:hypothetical protein [Novosphingobium sp. 9]|uniref:hypothetical protein n=1 Tax=Novosphingobium sp. 9 TaxID=2025349 RepID=UPI0021B50854|nr:hypothetical protein [Novosphingobium sp. 9]
MFNLRIRSTGAMVRPRTVKARDGGTYAVPTGPDHACPSPVRTINDLRPGDILLRDGHVVIFNGFTTVARATNRSRTMTVFEATSRCGAVCESTYDPTYFAGWWMLRLDTDGTGANCPEWLEDRVPRIGRELR